MREMKHSPLVEIAPLRFRYSFGDLISVNAISTYFDQTLLNYIFEKVMWFGRPESNYTEFEQSARAAYQFLKEGAQIKPKEVANQFYFVIERVQLAINKAILAQGKAKNVPPNDVDNQIQEHLAYYKVLCEALLPLVCAPVLYAFGISKNIKESVFIPSVDGKVNLKAIKRMEKWLAYHGNQLDSGFNEHVRNAYAHESFRILDDGKVELIDRDPHNPKKCWGPEVWSFEQLATLCDKLWINTLGITCGLLIYMINNQGELEKKGWIPSIEHIKLRQEELQNYIEALSDRFGFDTSEVSLLPSKISLTLIPRGKGIDQDTDLLMAGETLVNIFRQRIWYEERRVIDQVVPMLYELVAVLDQDCEIDIRLIKGTDPIGELMTDAGMVSKLPIREFSSTTIDTVRNRFKVDTLGDSITYVEKRGTPRHIETRPVRATDFPFTQNERIEKSLQD
jgi:hypothetical protein